MTRPGDPSLHLDKDDTLGLLEDVLSYLRHIQGAHKGSIGSINNVYLPQLRVDKVDKLAALVSEHLSVSQHKHQNELDITPEGEKRWVVEARAEVSEEWAATILASILSTYGMTVEIKPMETEEGEGKGKERKE